ncbi:uncharacterized protein F54H12.2-like [Haliotis rufescens]|uniref:uncharacterized protein F54H12.2-like n=1 Tax=Haliotis rufescens TaxID=6454 RepID=UPI001EB09DAF|nr:uncharacterized protein F54H12.2-like [Haliotis rufescens]
MSGPLLEDVFKLNRHLVNGVDVSIKLFRSSPQFTLMSGASDKEYKIELQDVYLKVCKLRMNNALALAHAKQFETANALYPYMKTSIRQASISASQIGYTFDNLFLDHCPTRVVVGFVSGEGVSGSYTQNPFNFQGSIIKTVGPYLDGVSVPGGPVEADDIQAYVNLFEGANTWREDRGNDIERTEFKFGNALFVFNLEPLY